jgi:hypothetical protein
MVRRAGASRGGGGREQRSDEGDRRGDEERCSFPHVIPLYFATVKVCDVVAEASNPCVDLA